MGCLRDNPSAAIIMPIKTLFHPYFLALALALLAPCQTFSSELISEYSGTCDASAAVALNKDTFVVGNDEDNVLRTYQLGKTDSPLNRLDLTAFLKTNPEHPEADIEAATRIGQIIYWITSHGANSSSKKRPGRRRFFATAITDTNGNPSLSGVGQPYVNLLTDLAKFPALRPVKMKKAAKIAPKEIGGLNIEGLSAMHDGGVLIGFRNPIPGGQALLIPLHKPQALITGQKAILGNPIYLDLGGRGVRSIEYSARLGKYLIIAGDAGAGGKFALYAWSGSPSETPQLINDTAFKGLQPEGMIIYDEPQPRVLIFSDDGTRLIDGKMCKETAPEKRLFRTLWLDL